MDAKITIQADAETWKRFRIACLEREVVAGRTIENLMRWQLCQWETRQWEKEGK
jgi:hypothetical protein